MVRRYGAATVGAITVTVLIWSTTFAALVAALGHFDVFHLLFLRWTLTAMLFAGYGVVTRMRLPQRADLGRIALAGLLGFAVYQMLLVMGQQGISASMAGFLVNLNPVFTTLIAVALRRDSAGPLTWVGLGLCTVGLALMGQANGGFGQMGWSAALVVLAALSFASYTLVTKPLFAKYKPLEVTTYAVVAGAIPFVFFAPGSLETLRTASIADLGTLVFLAVMPGGIAYLTWNRAISALPPGVAARCLYLIPVLGVPIAWVWVGEAPHALTVAGGLVTIVGVALASIKRLPWQSVIPAETPVLEPSSSAA